MNQQISVVVDQHGVKHIAAPCLAVKEPKETGEKTPEEQDEAAREQAKGT